MMGLRSRAIIGSAIALAACRGPADPPTTEPAPAAAANREAPPPIARAEPAPAPPPPPAPAPPMPERVVLISVDGLRPDIITDEIMPRHMRLMKEGMTARFATTIDLSDTLPSHAAMVSGRGVRAHGLSWNSFKENKGYIRVPTIFSAAREGGLSTAMIVGKQKLRHIAGPDSVDYFERPSYLCGGVARRAGAYLREHSPDLLFVHFSDPDEYGHSHGWMSKEYVAAAKKSDACLGTVLDAIDENGLADSTLVIVTADHGGTAHHHSNGREKVNSHIPWIARGPGIAPGTTIDEPVVTYDTAATTLAALGLSSIPNMAGVSRIDYSRSVVR